MKSHLEERLHRLVSPVLLFQWLFLSTSGINFVADHHILIIVPLDFWVLSACCYTSGHSKS